MHDFYFCSILKSVAYRGRGLGCSNPPRNSEVLTQLHSIANWMENVKCSYSNILISLKIAEFRMPTPQDIREKGSKILKLSYGSQLFYISNDK